MTPPVTPARVCQRLNSRITPALAAKKGTMEQHPTWPNGKTIAVSVAVMFETWSDGTAPDYSVQTTQLRPGTVDHAGKAWSTYGGRVGVWRLIRMLDRLQIPATFFTNARCAEEYPNAGSCESAPNGAPPEDRA